MPDWPTLLAFLPAAIALNLTPGADMMFCLGQGLRAGPRAALLADLGVAVGVMVHVLLAGSGLAALLAAQPGAFEAIRWAGIAYLLWLAAAALRHPGPAAQQSAIRPARAFRDGLAVNLLNPKVALFVLAFLPQFTDPAHGSVLAQMLVLGGVLATGGLAVNGVVGYFAGGIGRRLARSAALKRWLARVTAGIFVALAARLALAARA